ncbi:hypothetical protein [Sinorhizobium sp. BJ1]|uniref:hypothetical protein n=1 Tax=Sinorhizobium sp. BJ1 TaxID=2035455 RepID=UPI000BE82B5A|nr:hypothetical protein [Sinorhizobium sp. BJ1]PDT81593.1 hypothetical protein CO676_21565 [Sinorhizobium sp. BJ1]
MPLGMVNFSFDLFAAWREHTRAKSAPEKAAKEKKAAAVDRSDEEQARQQALFWGLFPVL